MKCYFLDAAFLPMSLSMNPSRSKLGTRGRHLPLHVLASGGPEVAHASAAAAPHLRLGHRVVGVAGYGSVAALFRLSNRLEGYRPADGGLKDWSKRETKTVRIYLVRTPNSLDSLLST